MSALSRGQWSRALVLLAALLMATLAARLGLWQLDRAQQKLALQSRIQSRGELPALSQAALARDAAAAELQHYRRITLHGRWLAERSVYLDNRQMDARQGFFVVTPLLLADGDAVLVQRGWSPRDFVDRTRLMPLVTPAGEVELLGRIAPPPPELFEFKGPQDGLIRQNLHLPAFAREIGLPLRPLSVQQLADALSVTPATNSASNPARDGTLDDGLLRNWPAPALDVSKHQGYALQWFALGALITGLYVWFQVIQPSRLAGRLARRTDGRPL